MPAKTLSQLATPTLPIKAIKSNGNVRVDVGDVTELAASIKATGLHQPLEVAISETSSGDPVGYLIDGHRRLAALKKLKWTEVPVTVATELDGMRPDEQRVAVQLVANMQRVDLTPTEEAAGYGQLKRFGWKQNKIARWLGRSEAHVSKRLSLLELPDTALDLAEKGRLGPEALYVLSQAASAGGDVDGLVAQLTENHDDDDEPIELEEVEHMARTVIRNAQASDDLSGRKIEYEEKGATVLILEGEHNTQPALPKDRIGWDLDLDSDRHLSEPCALVCLWIRWESIYESQHCTDRRRHEPAGASPLQLPAKKPSAEAQRQADARRRGKALTAAAKTALEGRIPARDRIIERMTVLYLNSLSASAHNRAAKFLDMAAEVGADYKGLSRLYDDADSTWRTKILLAAVIAHGHELSAATWGSLDEGHLAFLSEIGAPYNEADS